MSIQVRCGHCGKALKAPDGLAGKAAPCPICRELVQVPAAVPVTPTLVTPVAPVRVATTPARVAMTQVPVAGMHSPQPAMLPRAVSRDPKPESAAEATMLFRGRFFYWLFAVCLIPLALSLLNDKDDINERIAQTLKAHPEVRFGQNEPVTTETLLSKLPGKRIDGAHLSYDTWMHWVYALLATGGFFGVIWLLFIPGNASPRQVFIVGLATATFGIVFLLAVQWIAAATEGHYMTGASIVVVLFYIVKFIGFSYSAAMNPETGFWLSFLGFTFGVGLCEELTKALPIIFYVRAGNRLDWRGACMWGLASGIGFGIAEGIMYSSEHYNGFCVASIYLVRFVSCVGLHAIWGASAAIMVWRRREWLQSDSERGELAVSLLYILAVPMVLHGLYDTMLKKDMQGMALLVAVASFVWLSVLYEWTHAIVPRRRAAA
jgi:RsiW-degrading membrane proteinase PrsW (M82 family)